MILQLVIMAKLCRHVTGVDVTAIVAGEDRVTVRLTSGRNDLFGVVMARLGDGLRFGMAGISLAGTGLYASFGAGGFLCHLPVVPVVVQRRYYLLLNQRGMADFTFLALGQAGLRTGRLLAGNSDRVMARLGDGLRFGMAGISLAGTGLYASFGAGGFLCHLPVVPVVAKYLRFTLFGFPAFSALMGLYAGFRTGSFLRCFPLPPRMALGRNGAASPDGGSAILTIKVAGIALFGAGGFLLVYDNRVDVVVGVHLAHFSVVRMVALHILQRPPIPLLPDTVPHLFFFVDAGGFGNGRPTVRLVIMAIGSQHTVIWCVAVCLRRPTPITTAGVALFRHRGVCRKAADRNAGTQTQQQAQTCRKFPSSASHRVKPPLSP